MSIGNNIQKIQDVLSKYHATLVAVTKNRTIQEVNEAIQAGATHIGENRWPDARERIENLPSEVKKHFIGHLQSNKVKEVVRHFDVIQSVDSVKLAKKINDECEKIDKKMPIFNSGEYLQ